MSLFSRKLIAELKDEAIPLDTGLKRVLGPWQLTALGIGAIIGAGIFSGAGTAVAGGPHHLGAGPALVISYILVALACGFAALCYAEFASLIPQSGSAYTYAYATLGELVAWIIGWDLIIEYAVGNIAVAVSWSAYFQTLLRGLDRKSTRLNSSHGYISYAVFCLKKKKKKKKKVHDNNKHKRS